MRLTPRISSLSALCLLPALGGCLQDSASYTFAERDHAITLIRNQTFFWQNDLSVEVVVARLPDCQGGGHIDGVSRTAKIRLYQAPPGYPETLYILRIGKRYFAIGDQTCRFQTFPEIPEDRGTRLGTFMEKDDQFQFLPDLPQAETQPRPE